jgi:hypothetical protein
MAFPPPLIRFCNALSFILRLRKFTSNARSNISSKNDSTSDLLLGIGILLIVLASDTSEKLKFKIKIKNVNKNKFYFMLTP